MFSKQYIGYVKELNFLGAVTSVNFLEDTVTLTGDEDTHVVDREDVEFLPEVGVFKGVTIFHKDVLSLQEVEDKFVEVELHSDGLTQLHALDKDFNRDGGEDGSGEKFDFNESVEILELVLGELQGNIYELQKKEEKVDFNIKIVKDFDGKSYTYFYACNNIAKEEVDLIKVVFVGHQLLEEENYERRTLSHKVYLDSIVSGTLKEVSQSELVNFVTGIMYGKKEVALPSVEEKDCCEECCEIEETEDCCEVEETEKHQEDKDICRDCKQPLMVCDCELW